MKKLLLSHLLILLLIISFLTHLWDQIDLNLFQWLNGTLEGRPRWQYFWALANHKLTDWVEDLIFIAFFAVAIVRSPDKLKKTAQFIFTILLAATVIYFVNRLLFRENLDIPRESPSLVVKGCIRLSDEIPSMNIKDYATSSFPGDHATTLLFFAASYTFYTGRRLGAYAWAYALFRMLPRLIAGAHWISDIAVGAGSISLFFLSWAFCTPLHLYATYYLERMLQLCLRQKKHRTTN